MGRWLLPRGKTTRDQLSALLIGYIGIAADILEVFELFEEEKLKYNKSIAMATLVVFSWCLLSFCMVTTATTDDEKKTPNNKVVKSMTSRQNKFRIGLSSYKLNIRRRYRRDTW